ncbi:hypothetical protein LOC68_01600 [Blastopirellula sp. JC732]|uniref:Uncharacterized protein n=1 Tax=Blastopirellula sediminis TaxID=2894196 RepID=A0A9X1SHC9_9BACT|nr:hypothetical protein [Blastopirellula sediminis]MCC9608118.1 hypothetical protein [Blastopirellula sediminis]MCC9627089.1 hypothetical protein [Blastopirellula sediminis]
MTIFCVKEYDSGDFQGVVCDGRLASDIDDEEFITYFAVDGKRCDIRQRGIQEFASNPSDAFSDLAIESLLSLAIQNATEFELKEVTQSIEGQFLCKESQFTNREQVCRLELSTELVGEIATFNRSIHEIRTFEEVIQGFDSDPQKSNSSLPRLSEVLTKRATNLRLWSGLCIPICFRDQGLNIFGIAQISNLLGHEVNVRWVNGPIQIESGTELFCPGESRPLWRFGVVT